MEDIWKHRVVCSGAHAYSFDGHGSKKSGTLMMESQSRATSYDSAEWGTGIPQNWESLQIRDCGLKVFRSSLQISFIFF